MSLNVSESQFTFLQNGDKATYYIRLLYGLKEFVNEGAHLVCNISCKYINIIIQLRDPESSSFPASDR